MEIGFSIHFGQAGLSFMIVRKYRVNCVFSSFFFCLILSFSRFILSSV